MEYLCLKPGLKKLPKINFDMFRCVIVAECQVSSDWRSFISTWVLEQGCQYMLVCGVDADSWEVAFDQSGFTLKKLGKISNNNLLMSISYGDESLSEVFWLAKNASFHPSLELDNTLLFHISEGQEDKGRFLDLWRVI